MILYLFTSAQRYTISGYVESSESGERLAGAAVFDKNSTNLGTISNGYGFYSLTVPKMEVELAVSYVGYKVQVIKFKIKKDTIINFGLSIANDLDEIEIVGEKSEAEKTQMGKIDIPIKTIKTMPMLMGEVDIMKSIQLLPGVQSGSEGTSGLYVRGGGPDQNLILLDGVPVYNANHLFGFFSVFNADAISDVSLIKGGFPARYGGRLSSVIDIKMKEGNMKKFKGVVSIGLISSKFMIEGPIIKDRTSFMVSARRTYIDILAQPIIRSIANSENNNLRAGYYFWDINAKVNHKINERNRLFLSVYTGKDKAYVDNEYDWENIKSVTEFGLGWGNITSAFRWNHLWGKKLFSNATLTYSNYKFFLETRIREDDTNLNTFQDFTFGYDSGIEDFSGKIDFDYRPSPAHKVEFGANFIYHIFKPGIFNLKLATNETDVRIDTTFGNQNILANEYYAYVSDEIKISEKLKVNAGLHYSGFMVKDSFYQSLQPRISARFLVTPKFSLKAAYTHMTQYLHLLTNTSIGMPSDLWLPVTNNIQPQKSVQYAAGGVYSFGKFDVSIEGYYKTMNNLIEYKEGASFFRFEDDSDSDMASWEKQIETDGKGSSWGIELLVKKNLGKLSGWIGYTFSIADRQFSNINFGEPYPYTYDRRHDIGIVLIYQISKNVQIAGTWVYGTGNATTLALETYAGLSNTYKFDPFTGNEYYESEEIQHFDKRNNFRMPAYHRLDLSINLKKQKKRGVRTWTFGAYNVYNRKNPYFLMFGYDQNKRVLKQYSLFPIIPSFSYKFEFK